MKGRISAIQSLGTVDGPGLRTVIFAAHCPLRCAYCHNPETWAENGEEYEAEDIAKKVLRFKPYIRNGGVTFSGGEPLVQAKFFSSLADILKSEGLHIALDTSGNVAGEDVDELTEKIDMALLDIKFTTEEEYRTYTGGSLRKTLDYLGKLHALGKRVWIRQVIAQGLTDSEENITRLARLIAPFESVIDRVELLPFRKLCLEKYEQLGIPFPLAAVPETDEATIARLSALLAQERSKAV